MAPRRSHKWDSSLFGCQIGGWIDETSLRTTCKRKKKAFRDLPFIHKTIFFFFTFPLDRRAVFSSFLFLNRNFYAKRFNGNRLESWCSWHSFKIIILLFYNFFSLNSSLGCMNGDLKTCLVALYVNALRSWKICVKLKNSNHTKFSFVFWCVARFSWCVVIRRQRGLKNLRASFPSADRSIAKLQSLNFFDIETESPDQSFYKEFDTTKGKL